MQSWISLRGSMIRLALLFALPFAMLGPSARAAELQAETSDAGFDAAPAISPDAAKVTKESSGAAAPSAEGLADAGAVNAESSSDAGAPGVLAAPPPPGPPGLPRARLFASEPPTQQELDDRAGFARPSCNPRWGAAFPGLGALCTGRETEGELVLGIGALELGTGLVVGALNGFGTSAAEVPLLGFGDLFTAVAFDENLRVQRARRLPYVPQETLADDFSAPFRPDVLRQPDVFLGILGTVGIGILFEQYLDGPLPTQSRGQRPRLFGYDVNSSVAYPVSTVIGVGLFSQVAVAEELAFRGTIQSGLTRSYGEIPGWLAGSLIFGLFHATNIVFLAPDQRVDYLTHGVPFITLVGSYLGYTYMHHQYSLAPSIAVHFWYDFLIEATAFILDPKNSPLAFSYMF